MKHTISIHYPEALASSLNLAHGDFSKKMKALSLVKLYEMGEVSLAYGADMLGLKRIDFLKLLETYKSKPFHLGIEEGLERNRFYAEKLEGKKYINKGCLSLEDFIISEDIDKFDLYKLAMLNGISLSIPEGWYSLVLELLKELDKHDWDRHVRRIEEKDLSLRFYTPQDFGEIIEEFMFKFEETCTVCGEKGRMWDDGAFFHILCDKHTSDKYF